MHPQLNFACSAPAFRWVGTGNKKTVDLWQCCSVDIRQSCTLSAVKRRSSGITVEDLRLDARRWLALMTAYESTCWLLARLLVMCVYWCRPNLRDSCLVLCQFRCTIVVCPRMSVDIRQCGKNKSWTVRDRNFFLSDSDRSSYIDQEYMKTSISKIWTYDNVAEPFQI